MNSTSLPVSDKAWQTWSMYANRSELCEASHLCKTTAQVACTAAHLINCHTWEYFLLEDEKIRKDVTQTFLKRMIEGPLELDWMTAFFGLATQDLVSDVIHGSIGARSFSQLLTQTQKASSYWMEKDKNIFFSHLEANYQHMINLIERQPAITERLSHQEKMVQNWWVLEHTLKLSPDEPTSFDFSVLDDLFSLPNDGADFDFP